MALYLDYLDSDSLILRAAKVAKVVHKGQTRRTTGDPYVFHCMGVAGRVALLDEVTDEMVAAAWLHDSIEDTDLSENDIIQICGRQVAKLVVELTNPSKTVNAPRAEKKWMDRKHLASVSKHAKLIKLIDRIDNLREMNGASDDWIRTYLEESMLLVKVLEDASSQLGEELTKQIHISWGKLNEQ